MLAGELVYEVHKTCSPFNFGGQQLDCFGLDMNQGDERVHFDVCKVCYATVKLFNRCKTKIPNESYLLKDTTNKGSKYYKVPLKK